MKPISYSITRIVAPPVPSSFFDSATNVDALRWVENFMRSNGLNPARLKPGVRFISLFDKSTVLKIHKL